MSKKKEQSLEELVSEVLKNVSEDRKRVLDAYEKIETAFDSTENTMMAGSTAVKLLEQLTKSNEQVVKLAQIKERQESRVDKKDDGPGGPLDIEKLQTLYKDIEIEKN